MASPSDLSVVLPSTLLGGLVTWAGTASVQWWKSRGERAAKQLDAEVQIEQHRDQLTLDMLEMAQGAAKAAREEAKAARIEAEGLRPLQVKLAAAEARLVNFEEALEHISRLMRASTDMDRRQAERHATAFLTRMHRIAEATGTLMNELQVHASRETMRQRGEDAA